MNTTSKTLCALLLGAALTVPAMAQDAVSANNGNSATAQNNDNAAPAAAPTTPVQSSTTTASNSDAGAMGGSKMAMNSTGNAADLSSVPDTHKKYSRANRARDYRNEAAVTAQLNQKESSMSGTTAQ